jgi:predicted short-subunit dehydrogenase-like oxidoreductase (DUF2520 family)
MKRKQPSISLVGAGRVGSTLVTALHKEGYPVLSVVNRTGPAAVALARRVSCPRASTQVVDIDRSADIILIAVGDAEIAGAVDTLLSIRGMKLKKSVVLHTSGVHDAGVLSPLRTRGASVASFHPVQTFPEGSRGARVRPVLKGIPFGVDGDETAVKMAEKIAADLGGRILLIEPELRPLYHAACVFASSYLTTVLHAVSSLSGNARIGGSWTENFGPLMTASMENLVRAGAGEALTGPVARGDAATIGLHLRALQKFAPDFVPLYTVCGLEVARLALSGGKISRTDFDAILGLFRGAVGTGGGRPVKKR